MRALFVIGFLKMVEVRKIPYEDAPMPLGKFKGRLICDIPNWYLEFIKGEQWFRIKFPSHCSFVEQELKYRKDNGIVIKE